MLNIDSADDERLSDYCNLTDAAALREGFFIVEGHLVLQRLLDATTATDGAELFSIRSVLLSPSKAAVLTEIIAICQARQIAVLVAPAKVLAAVTDFNVHRGVLASVNRTEQPSLASILSSAKRLVLLEAVNDHENIGAIFRNAAALGVDAVILDGLSSDPLYRRSIRVSLGHVLTMPWCRSGEFASLLLQVRNAGFCLLGLTPHPDAIAVDLAAQQGILNSPVAFVLGAEGPGLSESTLEVCEHRVRIPMSRGVDSVNVATSLAVVASFAAARNE